MHYLHVSKNPRSIIKKDYFQGVGLLTFYLLFQQIHIF